MLARPVLAILLNGLLAPLYGRYFNRHARLLLAIVPAAFLSGLRADLPGGGGRRLLYLKVWPGCLLLRCGSGIAAKDGLALYSRC